MKLPRPFFKPLAIGAPEPFRELPVRLERMIHFVPPHIEKIRAKVPDLIRAGRRGARQSGGRHPRRRQGSGARGLHRDGASSTSGRPAFGRASTRSTRRGRSTTSRRSSRAAGNKLDVMMLPKVEGPWDIHYLDQLLAQLEANHGVTRPILIHAILETAEGVKNVDAIAAASPRMHGISLGPADLAASRAMKTTRVGGGHPDYVVLEDDAFPIRVQSSAGRT